MTFGLASYGLGFVAGMASTLSPCVLPLLPIVLASAAAAHRRGALALAAGLVASFTAAGLAVASVGPALGLDESTLRRAGAAMLLAAGALLLAPALQRRFAAALAGVADSGNALLGRLPAGGLRGQFIVGLLLGLVWSPCVGPTMGAAVALASQGRALGEAASMMAVYGAGAGVPLLALGTISRTATARWRPRLMSAAVASRALLGAALVALGLATLTGLDRPLEGWALRWMPAWMEAIATRY